MKNIAIDTSSSGKKADDLQQVLTYVEGLKISAQKRTRRIRLTFILLIVLLSLAGLSWQGFRYHGHQQLIKQIPISIRQQATFPLYIPTLDGFEPKSKSFSFSNDVLFFESGTSNTIIFTQQLKSPAFKLSEFSNNFGMSEIKAINLRDNQAILGKVNERGVAIIETKETIITITSATPQTSETIESIIRSLEKI